MAAEVLGFATTFEIAICDLSRSSICFAGSLDMMGIISEGNLEVSFKLAENSLRSFNSFSFSRLAAFCGVGVKGVASALIDGCLGVACGTSSFRTPVDACEV